MFVMAPVKYRVTGALEWELLASACLLPLVHLVEETAVINVKRAMEQEKEINAKEL